MSIVQVPEFLGYSDSQSVIRIETEKPDSRLSVVMPDVCADVRFEKPRDARDWRRPPGANFFHRERHNCQPSVAVKCLDGKPLRQDSLNLCRRHSPVQEQQLLPGLVADNFRFVEIHPVFPNVDRAIDSWLLYDPASSESHREILVAFTHLRFRMTENLFD